MNTQAINQLQQKIGISLCCDNYSPQLKSSFNMNNYNLYVAWLKSTNQKFPVNQFGELNRSLISRICGFGRDILYSATNPIRLALEHDLVKIGLELNTTRSLRADPKCNKSDHSISFKYRLDTLNAELLSLKNEVAQLKNENSELKQKLIEDSSIFTELTQSGRRFCL